MSWAKQAIEDLANGANSVAVRPRGNSMHPKVKSGARVVVRPIADYGALEKGDIVLVTVKGRTYLHLIKGKRNSHGKLQFLIGNNKGGINGWTNASNVHGITAEIA